MDTEFNAHVGIDSVGSGMFDGGVSAAMRDLARYGHLFVNKGFALDGTAVLPSWLVEDTYTGEPDSRSAFAVSSDATFMVGGMYRNGFWFPGPSSDVMLALGIHGQVIYINRATGVVAVKVSSWPTPQDAEEAILDSTCVLKPHHGCWGTVLLKPGHQRSGQLRCPDLAESPS